MKRHSTMLFFAASALIFLSNAAAPAQAQEPDQITAADLANARPMFHAPPGSTIKRTQSALFQSSVPGIDSVANFTGSYSVFGYDPKGLPRTNWSYNMLGRSPEQGGTTSFHAPIVPVSVLLLNADGSLAM